MDPILIFRGATVLQSIAAYLGLIESVSVDVKKLLHQSFVSAVKFLNSAKNSTGENQKEYIKEAMKAFTQATTVEDSENLISAYLGLSMCQFLLNDFENARISINAINDVKLQKSKKIRATVLGIFSPGKIETYPPSPGLGMVMGAIIAWKRREEDFENYKQKVKQIKILDDKQNQYRD